MRTPFVAGNWKMNGSRASAHALASGVAAALEPAVLEKVDVAVCPPFVFLAAVAQALSGSAVALGAQTVSEHSSGAYTGEVAPGMLSELGCRYVLVGHSERRALFAESDGQVAAKFEAVLREGMVPVLCVGEQLADRENGQTRAVVGRQLAAVVDAVGIAGFETAIVAYEPVWAIGTGKTATPQQAQAVHAFIREELAAHSPGIAGGLRIVYGGSVKGANAAGLFAMTDIDGGLIGGAALDVADFAAICHAAAG